MIWFFALRGIGQAAALRCALGKSLRGRLASNRQTSARGRHTGPSRSRTGADRGGFIGQSETIAAVALLLADRQIGVVHAFRRARSKGTADILTPRQQQDAQQE